MGFLNRTTVTVDAILTKKGRELLSRGKNEFKVTKFAFGDDEIDYKLWDVTHPNGTDYYGSVIENMPLLEAFPDENQMLRYKLVTLPKNTTKMPILQIGISAVTFTAAGDQQAVTPTTRNASDSTLGYTFILFDAENVRMNATGQTVPQQGATIPAFLSDDDLTNSQTVVAQSAILIAKATNITSTQLTIVGNETGATLTIPVSINVTSS